jgi:hypothetical protein
MIGTDYMNDRSLNAIFPDKREKSEIAIEILNECLDDISTEIGYEKGFNSNLYNKIRDEIYKARDQINKLQ